MACPGLCICYTLGGSDGSRRGFKWRNSYSALEALPPCSCGYNSQACGGLSRVAGSSAPSYLSTLPLPYWLRVRKASWNLINHWAMERTKGEKFTSSESHSPSFGVEHSGGPGAGSQLPSFLGLSLSSRGLPCWKGPRMSGSTKERSTKADVS